MWGEMKLPAEGPLGITEINIARDQRPGRGQLATCYWFYIINGVERLFTYQYVYILGLADGYHRLNFTKLQQQQQIIDQLCLLP